ncbi:MAG: hypothetical protein K8F91_04295 [Candidatus Obscuribacterales bacterium]|nr:hypothetical protein [Candidatus Obscuribacterales bacterium]
MSPAAKPEESAESEEKDTAESTTGSASSISQSKEASKGGTDTQELPIVPAALIDNVLSDESKQGKVRRKRVDTVESLPEQKPAPVSSVVSEQDREEAPSEIGSSAAFDIKRTDPLPMISIDIERLLQSVFNVTDKGRDLLLSKDVDALVKEVLKSVDRAKSLVLVLTDSNFSEASILATYSYCLNKGYIMHHDQVMELTVQLLLDRLDIEEYLLQRRRISSEQLNELRLISERQGIDLQKLLIGAGCLLPADLDRLKLERDRFVPQ